MGRRGPKPEKNWTIKFQRGKHYLVTWVYDIEGSAKRRKQLDKDVMEGKISKLGATNFWSKASAVKYTSQGRVYFDILERTVDEFGMVAYKVQITNLVKKKDGTPKKKTAMGFMASQSDIPIVTFIQMITEDIEGRLAAYENDPEIRGKIEDDTKTIQQPFEVVSYLNKQEGVVV
jgi:hypothetical protein